MSCSFLLAAHMKSLISEPLMPYLMCFSFLVLAFTFALSFYTNVTFYNVMSVQLYLSFLYLIMKARLKSHPSLGPCVLSVSVFSNNIEHEKIKKHSCQILKLWPQSFCITRWKVQGLLVNTTCFFFSIQFTLLVKKVDAPSHLTIYFMTNYIVDSQWKHWTKNEHKWNYVETKKVKLPPFCLIIITPVKFKPFEVIIECKAVTKAKCGFFEKSVSPFFLYYIVIWKKIRLSYVWEQGITSHMALLDVWRLA